MPLISVLRSPVFAFAPDRLAEIRARCPKGDFFHCAAVRRRGRYPAFSGGSGAAALSGSDMSVHRLLWHLYNRWNVLGYSAPWTAARAPRSAGDAVRLMPAILRRRATGAVSFVSHLRALLEAGRVFLPLRPRCAGVYG